MTREEAIDALSSEKEAYILNIDGKSTICYSTKRIQALEMAIEALQQEPCEDCIDRNLVLSIVKSGRIRVIDGEDWKRMMDNASEIRELPPVQPKQMIDWTCIDKLKAKSYSESEYGVPEFDANKVIQLSDAIEIIKDYCRAESEES